MRFEAVAVPVALSGERVDRAVSLITGRPRAEVARLIEQGAVRLNGETVMSRHRRVAAGELLDADLGPEQVVVLEPAAPGAVVFEVVHEDASVIVIDKPAGLVVHPGAGHLDDTLAAGLLGRYPDLAEAAAAGAGEPNRPGIVHRLDKGTSGLLVVARTPVAHRDLSAQLAARTMRRTYEALVRGRVEAETGAIEAPIGRSARTPTRMAVSATGKPARTSYVVRRRFTDPAPYSLLELTLETGRTHQIRVHLGAIGHPVAGDQRYGAPGGELGLARPFLHAARLAFRHPDSGEEVVFESALPADLEAVLEDLA